MKVGIPFSGCKHLSEVPCTSEQEAVAFAVGVTLGGGECSVFMQNDGFANCINIMTTLLKPYDIKIPLEVNVRHSPEHHYYMGKITKPLMELLGYAESN